MRRSSDTICDFMFFVNDVSFLRLSSCSFIPMEDKQDNQQQKRGRLTFFNLTNERVVDLLSYSKYLYYIGIIETILYCISIVGIPLIGFTVMATSFNNNPSIGRVDIVFVSILVHCSTFGGGI